MQLETRKYQTRTHAAINRLWNNGAKRVCLVAPTGSGKTLMLSRQIQRVLAEDDRVLWIVHRRELVFQAAKVLQGILGVQAVGVIMSGVGESPNRPIQVASIQTLLAREQVPPAKLLVIDECHHIEADTYKALCDRYQRKRIRILGATATPERQDGRALGDTFAELVVAASYSELINDKYLVPCDVLRPPAYLGMDLAQDPVKTYLQYGKNERAFIFTRRVSEADSVAYRLRRRSVRAEMIEGHTEKHFRQDVLSAFIAGNVRCLTNVYLLTEGIDVPATAVCSLARAFAFSGTMIQATGRVLRPAPNKKKALVIDLTGCTHKHGFPDADRAYSLTGRAISHVGPQVEERSSPCSPTVLDIALRKESRWDKGTLALEADAEPSEMSVAKIVDIEKARARAKALKSTRKSVRETDRRLREKFARNS